jgi:hypothetical protein
MDSRSQREINVALEYLENLSKENPDTLKKKLYNAFNGISFLVIEAKRAEFKKGWPSNIKNKDGEPMFNKDETKVLEDMGQKYFKPLFEENYVQQKGGSIPALKSSSAMQMIQTPPQVNPDDISIDKTFWKVRHALDAVSKKVHMYSRELGPFRFFYESEIDYKISIPIPQPAPPFFFIIQIPIPPRSIPIMVGIIIEAVRLIFSFGSLSNDKAREVLSLVLGIVDILKGDWKQGILSIIGFYGREPLIAGLIGKVLLNLLEFIAPDLQERIIMDLYQSGKSMMIGFLLWGFANFAPDYARVAARKQFDAIRQVVDNANGKIDEIEEAMQKSLSKMGLKVKFKDIPDSFVPTFDDIQNLQAIVRQPSIYCSKEFQEAMAPLEKIPPIRLVLELMSIPTDPETMAFECKGFEDVTLKDNIIDTVKPELTIQAPQVPVVPQIPQIPQIPQVKKGGTRRLRKY